MGQTRALFCLLTLFSQQKHKYFTNLTINDQSVDDMHGT